jgi:hypothetical protein
VHRVGRGAAGDVREPPQPSSQGYVSSPAFPSQSLRAPLLTSRPRVVWCGVRAAGFGQFYPREEPGPGGEGSRKEAPAGTGTAPPGDGKSAGDKNGGTGTKGAAGGDGKQGQQGKGAGGQGSGAGGERRDAASLPETPPRPGPSSIFLGGLA